MRKLFLFVPILLILFGSCTPNQDDSRLLLITKKNGVEQLFKLEANGGISRLANDSGRITNPALSPDRTQLAYMSEDLGNWDIYIYDIPSGKKLNVTNNPAIDGFPSWSNNGEKIAYMSSESGNRNIYISNIDGTDKEQVTSGESMDSESLWSPSNPSRIYFKAATGQQESLNRYDMETGDLYRVTGGGGHEVLRQIPGRNQISFIQRTNNRNALWVFDEDEEESYSLVETPFRMTGYAWSSDGKTLGIVINSNLEIYKYNPENGLMFGFTIDHAAYPAWSKNGEDIFYNKRIESGDLQIFKYNLKTNQEIQLTNEPFDCTDALPY